jgi:hypothetical protein
MSDDPNLITAAKDAAERWRTEPYLPAANVDRTNWGLYWTTGDLASIAVNARGAIIQERMAKHIGPDCILEFTNTNGGLAGFFYRIYDDEGQITQVFRDLYALWLCSSEKLDPSFEDRVGRMEYEATLENIAERHRYVQDDPPDDWTAQVFRWLFHRQDYQRECEPLDGKGGYPSDESIIAALRDLGLLDPHVDDED